jgi:hypothetical protein
MDAGLIGGLIGIGVIVCISGSYFLNEYSDRLKKRWKRFFQRKHQPLLPVVHQTPLLVRTVSKQFQMKDLF